MIVNITSTYTSTFENTPNISYSNFTNSIDLQTDKEKNILQLLPFILLGSFVIIVLIIAIIVCIKDNKHQGSYIAAVKSRKRGETITLSV
jgi:hypothetical protein